MIIWISFNILLFISTWHISSRLPFASIPERLTASALMSCTVLQIISWFLSIFKALTPVYYGVGILVFTVSALLYRKYISPAENSLSLSLSLSLSF